MKKTKTGIRPKLWKNFAKAVGADETIENVKLDWFKDMIENFFAKLENLMPKV